MKLPKRISPDKLTDSLIEIRYQTKLPYEVIVGLFYGVLTTYEFTTRPIARQQVAQQRSATMQAGSTQEIKLTLGGVNLFYNNNIKVQFHPNSIIFNCLNEYIGWDKYRAEINNFLNRISQTNVIDKYSRIGIRYITEYTDTDLRSCVKFQFTFGMPTITSDTFSFKSEFDTDGYKVILNLNNNLAIVKQKEQHAGGIDFLSSIDIDVILDNISITSIEELLNCLDKVHNKEKEMFFNLLKDEFLQTLNPQY